MIRTVKQKDRDTATAELQINISIQLVNYKTIIPVMSYLWNKLRRPNINYNDNE